MNTLLSTEKLNLRFATREDRFNIYLWLCQSNLTPEMMGLPKYPDHPIPSYQQFIDDYLDHYFDSSQTFSGQCFVIEYAGQSIGQINYNKINNQLKSTEIDIWLADKKFSSKGLGTEAIKILCTYLYKELGLHSIYIAPSRRNLLAVKAYTKAGFIECKDYPPDFVPDYIDSILMLKKMDSFDFVD